MKGNDISNEPAYRYWVMAEVCFDRDEQTEEEKRGWFKTMFSHRVIWTPDPAAMSELWRFAHEYGVRLDLVFVADMAKDATYLWDSLEKATVAANPFSDYHVMESVDKIAKQLPYRPDILGYIDQPSRFMAFGGKGMTVRSLR